MFKIISKDFYISIIKRDKGVIVELYLNRDKNKRKEDVEDLIQKIASLSLTNDKHRTFYAINQNNIYYLKNNEWHYIKTGTAVIDFLDKYEKLNMEEDLIVFLQAIVYDLYAGKDISWIPAKEMYLIAHYLFFYRNGEKYYYKMPRYYGYRNRDDFYPVEYE